MYEKYLTDVSYGDNLLGFLMDIEIHLESSGIFENVKVTSSEDVNCLINASCTFSKNHSQSEVENHLIKLWKNKLRYQEFEKHRFELESNKVVLYFCTVSSGLGVTGKIIAKCA